LRTFNIITNIGYVGEVMPYCPKCGKEVSEEDDFCTNCRTPLKEGVVYRRVHRRDEKSEKDEKNEKDEKHEDKYGSIVGGLILTWLGVLLFMTNQNMINGTDFGGYFLLGIGVILLVRGLLAIQQTGSTDSGIGFLIGGGVVCIIGLGITFNLRDWWAILLIGLGLLIVFRGAMERNRNPVP
jgi:hypothetical protein